MSGTGLVSCRELPCTVVVVGVPSGKPVGLRGEGVNLTLVVSEVEAQPRRRGLCEEDWRTQKVPGVGGGWHVVDRAGNIFGDCPKSRSWQHFNNIVKFLVLGLTFPTETV